MSTPLVCSFCRTACTVVLRDGSILAQLRELRCGTCHRTGSLQLERLEIPPPTRVGKYDEPPDDLSDEELLEHRRRTFPTTTPRR